MRRVSRTALILWLALLLAGCDESVSVPLSACNSQYTGRTETTLTYTCAAYDAKTGACTVQVPIITEYREALYKCEFRRMM